MDYVYRTFIYHIATLHAIMTEKFRSVWKGIFDSYAGGTDVWRSTIGCHVLVNYVKAHKRFELINI